MLGSCNRDIEEFKFKGVVVDARMCSSSQIGYVLNIIDGGSTIGVSYSTTNGEYDNAVIGYKSTRLLHDGDTIYGVAYLTKSYAALNCFGIIDEDLPEVILLSVDEEAY